MCIRVDGNFIISLFKYITAFTVCIVRSHILKCKRYGYSLRSTRLQKRGFLKGYKICCGFFDASVCIRRIIINLHNILTGHITCIGNCYIKGHVCSVVCHFTHFLSKGCIGKSVSKRINHLFVIVKFHVACFCLGICSFIETVSHINSFYIVNKCRLGLSARCKHIFHCILIHISVPEVTKVVGSRCI